MKLLTKHKKSTNQKKPHPAAKRGPSNNTKNVKVRTSTVKRPPRLPGNKSTDSQPWIRVAVAAAIIAANLLGAWLKHKLGL